MLSQFVARRDDEIAIRTALGALPADIVRLVAREAAVPVVCGAAAGMAIVLAGGRFAGSLLYGVTPRNPWLLAAACASPAAAAALAIVAPARRASSRGWNGR